LRRDRYDVVVVGGGHNALVAAAYLGRAGLSVCLLERADHLGGAAVSGRIFAGVDARLSRYSYLVSLLPDRIVADLGLRVSLASRAVASFTPVQRPGRGDLGLLVERRPGAATAESFRTLTGADREYAAWCDFYADAARLAEAVAPTLLEPLPPADDLRRRVGDGRWERLVAQPLGETLEQAFEDDAVRGVVLTDALIGTFASAHEPALRQNRCFLYHLIGNGTGEWRVPVGGMGAVTAELERTARAAGADLVTDAEVVRVDTDGSDAEVAYASDGGDGEELRVAGRFVLAGVAPAVLERLRGRPGESSPEGSQVKINMVLERLPRLRSGHDPAVAFAGTFHIDEGYAALESAHAAASAGRLPDPLPSEAYCHTLTDPSILGPDLAGRGAHTLTLFGLQTPARLFAGDRDGSILEEAVRRHVAGLDTYLAEPLAECLAVDAEGRPCLEAVGPRGLESSLAMPGGHIFHGDLSWPWVEEDDGDRWGVATDAANVLVCGAGARRGGGVSGIGGHNAAMAVLERRPT
jgi:phytoene dehydrogenase-like protein